MPGSPARRPELYWHLFQSCYTAWRSLPCHTTSTQYWHDPLRCEAVGQDELSGADIKAACTEAGLLALRERRMRVTHADFKKAKEKVLYKKKEGVPEGLYL